MKFMKNNRQITRTIKVQQAHNNTIHNSIGIGTQIGFPNTNKKGNNAKNIRNEVNVIKNIFIN